MSLRNILVFLTPVIKTGTKKVVHVKARNTKELIEVANDIGVGVQADGTPYEHITVTCHQARIISDRYNHIQLESDIYKESK